MFSNLSFYLVLKGDGFKGKSFHCFGNDGAIPTPSRQSSSEAIRDLTLSPSAVLSWAYGPQGRVSAADTVTVTSPGGSKA